MKTKPFIPNIIDIEASGLYGDSYPIEIGVALANGERYCSLITPADDWQHWDDKAFEVHKIERKQLFDKGKDVKTVAMELNNVLNGLQAYSDGWVVDNPWLIKLFDAAKISQQFRFSDLQMILKESQMDIWHQVKDEVTLDLKLARHRASSDARIIQETFIRTAQLV